MCDCYMHRCHGPGCANEVPMHLQDYATAREEVAVYCGQHLDQDPRGVVWEWSDIASDSEPPPAEWHRCRVVGLTDNAVAHRDGNHPNAWWVREKGGAA